MSGPENDNQCLDLRRIFDPEMPNPSPITRVYRLRVRLEGTRPMIWRRLEVLSGMTLPWLHCALDLALGWPSVRAHRFIVQGKAYGDGWGTRLDPQLPEASRRIDRLGLSPGEAFTYIHNLNREWRHAVLVESVALPVRGVAYPRLIGGARACPPDEAEHPEDLDLLMLPEGLDEDFDDPGEAPYDFSTFILREANLRFQKVLGARILL